jgi:hypothetical protein
MDGVDGNFFPDYVVAEEVQLHVEVFCPWTELVHGRDFQGPTVIVFEHFAVDCRSC